jgi:long-chain acyl-CoA synthetase
MTEMGPLITFNSPKANRHGTVGKPVPGVEVRIVDNEVQARGLGLMNGYFNRPDLTQRVLTEGWLKTGDLGSFDADGFLTLTGRRSDILVLPNGKNVNAPRIEELLAGSELVLEAGLTVRNGRLFALVYPDLERVRKEGIINLNEALKWGLLDGYNRRCAPHERILDFGISPRPLPRTRLGKLKRHQLAALITDREREREIEGSLAEIDPRILEFLHAEGLSAPHSRAHLAIDLGLDSLALIEFRKHLERLYRLGLSETVFIEHPSLKELHDFLAELEKSSTGRDLAPRGPLRKTLFEGGFSGWTRPLLSLATFPFRIERRGTELLRESTQPLIIVSNHQSFLDPILVLRVLPEEIRRNTFFMAKTRIFNSWFGRRLLRRINAVLLDLHQSSEHLLEQSREILRSGRHLMIFPEGTRSFDGKLGRFSRAFAMLARETGARIVPLMIRGAYDLMPRTRLIPRFGRVELTVLPALDAPYPEPETLNEQVFAMFRKHLGEEEQ